MPTTLQFAAEVVRQAGKLLSEHFIPFGMQADSKPDNSLITQADLAADRLITSAIRTKFPEDLILSEESNTFSGNQETPIWVIDPLDGTTNFSLGLPIWGVSIARLVAGYPRTAVLYFPKLDELYCAEQDQGATLNGESLEELSSPHEKTSFFACCSRTIQFYKVDLPYKTRILGAAAYNLCCVARNTAIMAMEVTPKIWDLAAGWLIVKESGKVVEVLEGQSPFPLKASVDYKSVNYPIIAAKNERLLSRLRQAVQKRNV